MSHPQIQPSVFAGPAAWHTLYYYVSVYEPTPRNKVLYKNFIELFLKIANMKNKPSKLYLTATPSSSQQSI